MRISSAPIIAASLLILSSCTAQNPVQPSPYRAFDWPTDSPESQGIDPGLLADAVAEAGKLFNLRSLLIVRHGTLVSETYFRSNRANRNDPWDVRSVTKSVVSAAVGVALHRGMIDSLDQAILDFFTDYDTTGVDPRMQDVTVRHLLTMTAGIAGDDESPLPPGILNYIQAILELPLSSDPGTAWNYSSLGVHLLSGIVQQASGMNLAAFTREYVTRPLGITLPGWETDAAGYPFGGTGLWLMPRDMARFGHLYLKEGLVDRKQIVPAEWVRESLSVYAGGDGSWGVLENLGYGYLWSLGNIVDFSVAYALGYGGQIILVVPELDTVIVTTAAFPDSPEQEKEKAIFTLIGEHVLPAIIPGH